MDSKHCLISVAVFFRMRNCKKTKQIIRSLIEVFTELSKAMQALLYYRKSLELNLCVKIISKMFKEGCRQPPQVS